jgi:muramoyltetrapeptide carboxypeptidase
MRLEKPPPLEPGSKIVVVTPGSVPPLDRIPRGIARLRALGYRVWLHPSVPSRRAYLAGADQVRARALQQCFEDPSVAAVFCAAGGYGSLRVLPHLDFDALAHHPKIFLGFSDVTAIHVSLNQRSKLVTFHGPMVAATMGRPMPAFTNGALWGALTRRAPMGELPLPRYGRRLAVVRPGRAQGLVAAGNLSIVVSLLATPYALDPRGKLLFLEETSEHPCRLDEMITQLKLAGVFDACAGVVFARLHRCRAVDSGFAPWNPLELLSDAFRGYRKPVLYGLEFGHTARMLTLPCSVMAEIETRTPSVRITESALA